MHFQVNLKCFVIKDKTLRRQLEEQNNLQTKTEKQPVTGESQLCVCQLQVQKKQKTSFQ